MSTPGDNSSWTPQNGDHDASAQPAQDPWAQPPAAGQDPYGPPSAGASPYDPYGQQPSAGSASDPYGQQAGGAPQAAAQDPFGTPASGASASDPYGQPSAGASPYDPYGQPPSAGSASDPYGQGQQQWSPAQDAGAPQAAAPGGAPYGQAGGAPGPAPQGQLQSRLVVGLLGIFLGGFGVHRFLLGYTTIGIIQIVVTVLTCGAGALWGLIEGIMVLAKSPSFERDAHGRPLTD